jgi:hypothetical protein
MPPASAKPSSSAAAASARARKTGRPFFGLIDPVLVEDPLEFEFDGAISRQQAYGTWIWLRRDLAADLIDPEVPDEDPSAGPALDALMPELLGRARTAIAAAGTSHEAGRRLKTQLGGEEAWSRLPNIVNALKCRGLLDKAQAFGRATNGMTDEAALALALQSMPLNDQGVAALLMQAAVGQITNPSKLMTAVVRITGSATEVAIQRAGFTPLIDAILAHAQNQKHGLVSTGNGAFADIDLICKSVDRFHRLMRAVNGYMELSRNSRWTTIVAALTKTVSERIEPKLRDVVLDVNKALRRHPGQTDRLDSDQLLLALNGVYVLATVRDAKDSLALNAIFDQAWAQVGQALEIHIQRNLEVLRHNPADKITSARLEASIKMAELRFNAEYAEVLRRAKETAARAAS